MKLLAQYKTVDPQKQFLLDKKREYRLKRRLYKKFDNVIVFRRAAIFGLVIFALSLVGWDDYYKNTGNRSMFVLEEFTRIENGKVIVYKETPAENSSQFSKCIYSALIFTVVAMIPYGIILDAISEKLPLNTEIPTRNEVIKVRTEYKEAHKDFILQKRRSTNYRNNYSRGK